MTSSSPDERPIGEQIEEAVGNAIVEVMKKLDQSYAVKWVAAIEVMQEDGDKGIWTIVSPVNTRWDTLGMICEMQNIQSAHNIAHIIMEHGIGGVE